MNNLLLNIISKYDLNCELMPEYINKIYNEITPIINSLNSLNYLSYNTNNIKLLIKKSIYNKYNINNEVINLSNLKQYKQREPEWYEARKNMISASDMASVFKRNKYKSKNQLLKDKVLQDSTFTGNKFTRHGQKYEDVASIIYQYRNNYNIIEFGLLIHPLYSFVGASPDGITHNGRMLEIKCPYSRVINGIVPDNYEVQMQIQLEVCNLEICDFCEIRVHSYDTLEEYLEDYYEDNIDIPINCNKLEKGLIIGAKNNIDDVYIYFYPKPYMLQHNSLLFKWRDETEFLLKTQYNYVEPCYWYLTEYSCVEVKRNKEWFDNNIHIIKEFWEEIEYYRDNIELFKSLQPKKRQKKNDSEVNNCRLNSCIIDDDEDDNDNDIDNDNNINLKNIINNTSINNNINNNINIVFNNDLNYEINNISSNINLDNYENLLNFNININL